MKNIFASIMVLLVSFSGFSQNNGEPMALGLPGDNLNLYAVLDIFQKSPTLEEFERTINDKSKNINNLDLNNDRNIDYLRILSHEVSNTHTIVIQDPISPTENQDVAVIEVSKEPSGKVFIQIIGDEALYGKNYIIEPSDLATVGTPNPGYQAGEGYVNENHAQYRPVNDWIIVNFLFAPAYVVYRSPYNWGYYPVYWHPWAPIYYENYWGYNHHYYANAYYRRTIEVRSRVYYSNYAPRRISSPIVVRTNNNGGYRETYNGHQFRNFGDENHHENGTPRSMNNTHDTNPRGTENGNHPNSVSPRGTINNTNSPRLNGTPKETNTIANPRTVAPRPNQQNMPASPRSIVTPRQNQENNPSPRSIETPRQNQENNVSNPRTTNVPRANSNDNVPRNNAPAPRAINNGTPRNATPRNMTPSGTTKSATKIEGRR